MMPFEYFLKKGDVKKTDLNIDLAKSLIKDMHQRIKDVSDLNINKKPKIIFENIYDALRDFCDAVLAVNGFKSYSHQASISYLIKTGFTSLDIDEFDQYRYKRNGSKYYGEEITDEDAKRILEFYNRIKNKINKFIRISKLK